MIHQRQRPAFSFKPRNHTPGIHARLDDFESYLSVRGKFLLGHEHDSAAALADLLQQLITANAVAWFLAHQDADPGRGTHSLRRLFQECAGTIVRRQQGFDPLEQGSVIATSALEEVGALVGGQFKGLYKQFLIAACGIVQSDNPNLAGCFKVNRLADGVATVLKAIWSLGDDL
jgi:hypothetical protein